MNRRASASRAGYALLAGCALAACESDRTTVFDPVGPPSIDFLVATGPQRLPAGRVDREIVETVVDTIEIDSVNATSDVLASVVLVTDSVFNVRVRALRALGGGQVYQVWNMAPDGSVSVAQGQVVEYFSFDTGLPDPITGDPVFAPDSNAAVAGATYAGSDDRLVDSVAFQVPPAHPDNVGNPFDNTVTQAVFVTIEDGPATTPGPRQFLWLRVGLASGGTVAGVTVTADTVVLSTNTDDLPDTIQVTRRSLTTFDGSGDMVFGNFGGLDVVNRDSPRDYVFGPRGAGQGGARGPEISVDLLEIARPPVGFFYAGYIVDAQGAGVLVDTLRSSWSPDPTISRVNLHDADVSDLLPQVVGTSIRESQVRNCASDSGVGGCQNTMGLPATDTFAGYAAFVLKLEPKGGVAASATKSVSHRGDLPDQVK